MPDNKRKYYRTRYPVACRPALTVSDTSYEVIDISEGGIKILYNEKAPVKEGSIIKGTITFIESDPLEIEGEVIRIEKGVASIKFFKEVPFQTLFEQQKYIKINFPEYFGEAE